MATEAIFIALALIAGVDLRVVGILGLALWQPVVAAFGVVAHVLRARSATTPGAANFCHLVARELRSGRDLRSAMAGAARSTGAVHLAAALDDGKPIELIGSVAAAEYPEIGDELAVVITAVASTGAASADLFEEMGDLALGQLEMAQEVATAIAPARASAAILIGLPVSYLAYQVVIGNASELFLLPGQRLLALVGWGLVLAGLVSSALIVKFVR